MATKTHQPEGWLSHRERGSLLGLQVTLALATRVGRPLARYAVRLIAAWFFLFDARARRASRHWLQTVFGRPARWREVLRHFSTFAEVTLDRVFLLRGETQGFDVSSNGHHHLQQAVEAGRGALLIGAHLGSFEAMRADGERLELPLNIIGHFQHARMTNALLGRLNPGLGARVIEIDPNSVDFIFEIQNKLEKGELVATMGDRVGLNEKSLTVEFFGRPARLPSGPFILASVLKCPVFLTFGLYSEPNRYSLYCEPFADHLRLPRKDREKHLRALVQRFAHRLEDYCRQAPYNWFNFYDFWEGP